MDKKNSKRTVAMRKETQDAMRERIKASGVLTNLLTNHKNLQQVAEDMVADETIDLSAANQRIDALEKINRSHFRLLNKILPDLKATELNITGGLKVVAIDMTGVDDDDETPEEAED